MEHYLKIGAVKDEYLAHELEKMGVKVQTRNPRLKNKEMAAIDTKAYNIETQEFVGYVMCNSSILDLPVRKIKQLDGVLCTSLLPSDYNDINAYVDF